MLRIAAGVALMIGSQSALPADCPAPSRERYEPRSFLGYACGNDCERHKAGFAWAVEYRVSGHEACEPLEPAAAEGCRVYVEERLTPEQAGARWAIENEIVDPCLCDGGGEGFRAGCLRHARRP
jgi:hypothetical protein